LKFQDKFAKDNELSQEERLKSKTCKLLNEHIKRLNEKERVIKC